MAMTGDKAFENGHSQASALAAREKSRVDWLVAQGRLTYGALEEGAQVTVTVEDHRGTSFERTMEAGRAVSITAYTPHGDLDQGIVVTPLWSPRTPDWIRNGEYINKGEN